MNIKKALLGLLTLSVIVSAGTGIKASAEQRSTSTNSSSTISDNDSIAQNNFNRIMENIHKKNNAKSVSTVDKYINIQNVSEDPSKPVYKSTQYTKKEFLQKNNSVSGGRSKRSISQQNSWVKLKLEIDNTGSGKRDIYGFYQWLTPPKLNLNDVVGLGHDSNTVFDFDSSYLDNLADYKANGQVYTYNNHLSPSNINNRVFETDGVGYRFKLGNTSQPGSTFAYPGGYEYGVLHVSATPGASANGPIIFSYGHQQVNVSTGIGFGFNGAGNLSFQFGTYYDIFKVADTVHF